MDGATLRELRRGFAREPVLSLPGRNTFASCGDGLPANQFCPYPRETHHIAAVPWRSGVDAQRDATGELASTRGRRDCEARAQETRSGAEAAANQERGEE